jgi:hypothetical protein
MGGPWAEQKKEQELIAATWLQAMSVRPLGQLWQTP